MAVPFETILEDFTSEERAEIERGGRKIAAANRTLKQLRKSMDLTQQQLAKVLKISQASLSEIENKNDALISTVARVVEGVGGHLELYARMPDGSAIPLEFSGRRRSRKRGKGAGAPVMLTVGPDVMPRHEPEVAAAKSIAEATSKARSSEMATISEVLELMEQANAILGWMVKVEGAVQPSEKTRVKKFLLQAHAAVRRAREGATA